MTGRQWSAAAAARRGGGGRQHGREPAAAKQPAAAGDRVPAPSGWYSGQRRGGTPSASWQPATLPEVSQALGNRARNGQLQLTMVNSPAGLFEHPPSG